MHNLLNFLVKNSYWFLFILLEVICFYFIFSENSYQRSVFLNSSNEVSGRVYALTSGVTSYFGLKDENVSLLEYNGKLQNRVDFLEHQIFELTKDSLKTQAFLDAEYEKANEYIAARVLNNSVAKLHNYITIDKGSKDGVTEGMGVISQAGIVGEVRAVSFNFAVVQSVLNSDSKYSSTVLRSNAFGPLVWKMEDPRFASILDYPAHEKVVVGDTVVTSGHSDTFPRGILVGTVSDFKEVEGQNHNDLTIELSTDFVTLKNVLIVKRNHLKEKQALENRVKNVSN